MLVFAGSVALAVLSVFLLLGLAYLLRTLDPFQHVLAVLRGTVGEVPTMVLTGLGLFVVYFFVLTAPTIRYIETLNRAVDAIAEGEFDTHIPEGSADELGSLGRNLARMASQLRQSLEQERQAERTKHELITSVSHDLRTPLTSVLGYLELVDSDRYGNELEMRHYVGLAYEKGKQLKRLVDQLFEYTRTSHGSIRLKSATINLGELLEQLVEEFVPALQEAGMEYQLQLPATRVMATVDPDLLVRVLENLVSNAIRYGREGRIIVLELLETASGKVIRVANLGSPIPEHDLPYLFDRFYRVEQSRSGKTGGAGLGLAIARNIVNLHGGRILAYNEASRTVFEIRLPA